MAVTGMAERIATDLRDRIIEGALRSGTRLTEDAMAVEFGVSRNTLRESFRLLEQERLLVYELNRGVFVRTMSADDVADLYRARRVVELTAVRGSSTLDVEGLARVAVWSTRGAEAAAANDWTAAGTANMRFHQSLVALAGSDRLNEFARTVLAELRLVFGSAPDPQSIHGPFVHRNVEIEQLVTRGRFMAAADRLGVYLDDAESQAVEFLAKENVSGRRAALSRS